MLTDKIKKKLKNTQVNLCESLELMKMVNGTETNSTKSKPKKTTKIRLG